MPHTFPNGVTLPTLDEFKGSEDYKNATDEQRQIASQAFLKDVHAAGRDSYSDWKPQNVIDMGVNHLDMGESAPLLKWGTGFIGEAVAEKGQEYAQTAADVGYAQGSQAIAMQKRIDMQRNRAALEDATRTSLPPSRKGYVGGLEQLEQQANRRVAEANQLGQQVGGAYEEGKFWDEPFPNLAKVSIASMIGMGKGSGGLGLLAPNAAIAAGLAQEFPLSVQEELSAAGFDLTDPQVVQDVFNNPENLSALEEAIETGQISATTIGLLDTIASVVGMRGAGKVLGKTATSHAAKRVGREYATEGAFGGAGEAAAMALTGKDLDAGEISLEAFAGVPLTASAEAAGAIRQVASGKPQDIGKDQVWTEYEQAKQDADQAEAVLADYQERKRVAQETQKAKAVEATTDLKESQEKLRTREDDRRVDEWRDAEVVDPKDYDVGLDKRLGEVEALYRAELEEEGIDPDSKEGQVALRMSMRAELTNLMGGRDVTQPAIEDGKQTLPAIDDRAPQQALAQPERQERITDTPTGETIQQVRERTDQQDTFRKKAETKQANKQLNQEALEKGEADLVQMESEYHAKLNASKKLYDAKVQANRKRMTMRNAKRNAEQAQVKRDAKLLEDLLKQPWMQALPETEREAFIRDMQKQKQLPYTSPEARQQQLMEEKGKIAVNMAMRAEMANLTGSPNVSQPALEQGDTPKRITDEGVQDMRQRQDEQDQFKRQAEQKTEVARDERKAELKKEETALEQDEWKYHAKRNAALKLSNVFRPKLEAIRKKKRARQTRLAAERSKQIAEQNLIQELRDQPFIQDLPESEREQAMRDIMEPPQYRKQLPFAEETAAQPAETPVEAPVASEAVKPALAPVQEAVAPQAEAVYKGMTADEVRAATDKRKKKAYKWGVNYTEQEGSGRTTELKLFDSKAEATEFSKGKHGYLTRLGDESTEFDSFVGGFEPSAQEQNNISKMTTAVSDPTEATRAPSKAKAMPQDPSKAEKWADEQIAKANLPGKSLLPQDGKPLDAPLMTAYAIKGAIHLANGVKRFAVWSKRMVKQFGNAIKPHLRAIHKKAVELLKPHSFTRRKGKRTGGHIGGRSRKGKATPPPLTKRQAKKAEKVAKKALRSKRVNIGFGTDTFNDKPKPKTVPPVKEVAKGVGELVGLGVKYIIDNPTFPIKNSLLRISKDLFRITLQSTGRHMRKTQQDLKKQNPFAERAKELSWENLKKLEYTLALGESTLIRRMVKELGMVEEYKQAREMMDDLYEYSDEEGRMNMNEITVVEDSKGNEIRGEDVTREMKREALETNRYRYEFWPREMIDYDGLREHLGQDALTMFEKVIKDAEQKKFNKLKESRLEAIKNDPKLPTITPAEYKKMWDSVRLNDDERAKMVGQTIRGYGDDKINSRSNNFYGERYFTTPEKFTPEMMQFYASPFDSTINFVRRLNETVEMRKALGLTDQTMDNLTGEDAIGAIVDKMARNGKMTNTQQMDTKIILNAFYNHKGMNAGWAVHGNIETIVNLGNVLSTMTQVADSFMLMRYLDQNPKTWVEAAKVYAETLLVTMGKNPSKGWIMPDDIGVDTEFQYKMQHAGEQMKSKGMTSGLVRVSDYLAHKVLASQGFKKADIAGKMVQLNMMHRKFTAEARRGNHGIHLDFMLENGFTEREAESVVSELKNGVMTENVRSLLFMELSEIQPVSALNMPLNALGKMKPFYKFLLFPLNRLADIRTHATHKARNQKSRQFGRFKTKKGAWNPAKSGFLVSKLILINMLAEAPSQMARDAMRGKDVSEEMDDMIVDLFFRSFLFNRYFFHKAREAGPVEAVQNTVLPPFRLVGSLGKDFSTAISSKPLTFKNSRTLAAMPAFGWVIDSHLGGRGQAWRERVAEDVAYTETHDWVGEPIRVGFGQRILESAKELAGRKPADRYGTPTKPDPSKMYGDKQKMAPEQYREYVKLSGEITARTIAELGLPLVWTEEIHDNIVLPSRKIARDQVVYGKKATTSTRSRATRSRAPRRRVSRTRTRSTR